MTLVSPQVQGAAAIGLREVIALEFGLGTPFDTQDCKSAVALACTRNAFFPFVEINIIYSVALEVRVSLGMNN
jgi:hypothetical protein